MNISVTKADEFLSSYFYELPPENIAQFPLERGASRLLVVDRQTGGVVDSHFSHLLEFLPEGALLVANNSRVIPARVLGQRASGGKIEFLLLTPLPLIEKEAQSSPVNQTGLKSPCGNMWKTADTEGLLKPGKRVRAGEILDFGDDFKIEVLSKGEFGQHGVRLHWQGCLRDIFETRGHLPLPPYIRREDTCEDKGTYQTVYAREDKAGSVAAPTAGLHFTKAMRHELCKAGFGWQEVTLHVGYGTFSPVRCANIRDHKMHAECVEVTPEVVRAVADARAEGRPVIAVGTTSARTLEGVAGAHEGMLQPYTGWINCFMYPGYEFQVIDGLITNFHLPESTLLMLVSALTGRERMLEIYNGAVQKGYRFFSYGDAMLIR